MSSEFKKSKNNHQIEGIDNETMEDFEVIWSITEGITDINQFICMFGKILKIFIEEKIDLATIGDKAYMFYAANMDLIEGSNLGELLKLLSGMEFEPEAFPYSILNKLANDMIECNVQNIEKFIVELSP